MTRTLDDLFGKVIAAEIRKFPSSIKFRVKHEINTVIFNYQVQQAEQPRISTIPPIQTRNVSFPDPIHPNQIWSPSSSSSSSSSSSNLSGDIRKYL